jgi:hypothetical protein
MYLEIADPPLLLGASHEIVAEVSETELVTFLGTEGADSEIVKL